MASVGTVVIEVDANIAKLVDGMKKSQSQLGNLERTATKAKDTIANFAKAAAGIYVVNKAFEIAKESAMSFVETAAKFEQFETTLTSITGSSKQAEQSMSWIRDFAAKTPFEIDQVTEAFVKMKAYGLNPTDGTLKSLGNTASAMGKDITQAVEAMADAVTGENERLKEFGVKAKLEGEQVAYTWADSSGRTRNIVIKNNKDIIQSTLNAIFNEKYTGAMDAQSKTWNGVIANMRDAWTNFKVDFMDAGLFAYIKSLANTIATYIKAGFTDAKNGAKDFSDGAINFINGVISVVGFLKDVISGITLVFKAVEYAVLYMAKAVMQALNAPMHAINYLIERYNALGAILGYQQTEIKAPTIDTSWTDATMRSLEKDMASIVDGLANNSGQKLAETVIEKTKAGAAGVTAELDKLASEKEKYSKALDDMGAGFGGLGDTAKTSAKGISASNKSLEDSVQKAEDLRRKYLELTNQKDKLFQMDTEKTLSEFSAGGYSQEELSKLYDGMWDQYTDKGIEANKEITMDFTSQFEGMLKGIFSGDLGGAIKGFVDGISTELMAPMIKSFSDSISSWTTNLMGGLGTMGSGLLGLGLGLIGAFSSNTVSQAEIDAAKGETEFSDESIKNLGAMFEQVQYPMLEATNKMYKHIRNMDENFYQIARAISAQASAGGVDITGGSFIPKASANLYSSKTLTLLSSGLKFDEQLFSEMMDPNTLLVQAYEKVLSQKDYLWKSSSYIATKYKDLPPEVMNSLADVFSEGFNAILEAGTLLGINGLEEQIKNITVDMGTIDFKDLSDQEVADRLNEAISTMFSGVIGQVDAFTMLLDRYAVGAEDSMETLIRIATEYDQASHYFSLIGKDFNEGIYDFTKTWTETYITATGDYTDILGRTVDDAFVEMYSSLDGLTRTWLRPVMEEVTLVFTETTKEIYTAQMQMLDIVESAGGMQSFSDAMGVLMSNFYTDAEQLEFMVKSLDIAFETLGIKTMPTTNDEFRTLLETMDTSTEEGAYLYGQILLLAESFNSMTTAAEQLTEETSGMMREISDAWLSDLSYLTLAQKADYASAYYELARTSNGLISGVDAARANAEYALKTTASKEEYIPIFNRYISEIEKQTKDATNLDLLEELKNIRNEVIELREATYNAATYA